MKSRRCIIGAVIFMSQQGLVVGAARPAAATDMKYPDRGEFAKRMAAVDMDMPQAEVMRILGRPDRVRPRGSFEVWQYGLEGHNHVPTLGEVAIVDGKTNYATGGEGSPPPASVISERELRAGICHIYISPDAPAESYGIRHTIRSVNYLRRLGTLKSRAILAECSRILGSMHDEYLYRIAFSLFEIPRSVGYMPEPRIFVADPTDRRRTPRHPIAIVDGIPFYLHQQGVGFTGWPEGLWQYLERFPKDAQVRSDSLVPSADPFASLLKLMGSDEWRNSFDEQRKFGPLPNVNEMTKDVLHLVSSAFRPRDPGGKNFYYRVEQVIALESEFLEAGVKWDARRQEYVRRDGSNWQVNPLAGSCQQ